VDQELGVSDAALASPATLLYFDEVVFGQKNSQPRLVWLLEIITVQGGGDWLALVDALSGEIVRLQDTVYEVSREVYNGGGNSYVKIMLSQVQTKQIMDETGFITGVDHDEDAQRAYDYAGLYTQFLVDTFNRQGYADDSKTVLKSYVHVTFPKPSWFCPGGGPNAAWVKGAVYYSDGFSAASDVVAHELTHAMVDNALPTSTCGSGLCYERESGALNESYADVFAVLMDNGDDQKNWQKPDWKISDWMIGEDLPIGAIRSLEDPTSTKKPQPDYMEQFASLGWLDWPNCRNDYGYVHTNSGIMNKAAYLLMQIGQVKFHDVTVTGIGPKKVAQIYYLTLTSYLIPTATFRDARDGSIAACISLIGKHNITVSDCVQVINAFAAVGIGPAVVIPATETPVTPSVSSQPPPPESTTSTATALIFDVSGSMDEYDASGMTKLQAAQAAGADILNIIAAENQAQGGVVHNDIAIVSFSNTAWVNLSLTTDVSAAQSALQGLYPMEGTGMPDGLKTGLDLLSGTTSGSKPIIILLTDGLPNVGQGGDMTADEDTVRKQVLDLASQAGQQGMCVYTVGFGDPYSGNIDEGFLGQVSANSGCGTYYNAQDANDLANVYIELRHLSTGDILLQKGGQISQSQQLDLGSVDVPQNQSILLYTLNWPGSRLDPILIDPSGQRVDASYPGASISTYSTLASIVIANPKPGTWQLAAFGADVPEGTTDFNALLSARPAPPTEVPTPPQPSGLPVAVLFIALVGGGRGNIHTEHTEGKDAPCCPFRSCCGCCTFDRPQRRGCRACCSLG
jgi:Mg-chelatase subunit ChlD